MDTAVGRRLDDRVDRLGVASALFRTGSCRTPTESMEAAITFVDYAPRPPSVSYPIAKGFRSTTGSSGWNDSNNTDMQVYQYHYNTQTYLFGFTYAY